MCFSFNQGFWYFAWSQSREVNQRNPAKFTKARKIPRNLLEILPNTCRHNIFQGSKLTKSLSRHLATKWWKLVAKCKFLVAKSNRRDTSIDINDILNAQGFAMHWRAISHRGSHIEVFEREVYFSGIKLAIKDSWVCFILSIWIKF